MSRSKSSRTSRAEALFIRAEKEQERGRLRSAFRLLLAGAKLGDSGCQLNLGNFYDDGTGLRRNMRAAIYWYTRAYRAGYSCAAHNLGVLWRNEKRPQRSLYWFRQAVRLGDAESNLDIAKHYLEQNKTAQAIPYLRRVINPGRADVSEAGTEEAQRLLKRARNQLKKHV